MDKITEEVSEGHAVITKWAYDNYIFRHAYFAGESNKVESSRLLSPQLKPSPNLDDSLVLTKPVCIEDTSLYYMHSSEEIELILPYSELLLKYSETSK